jgi:two-component system sensor histidine kinase BaeS
MAEPVRLGPIGRQVLAAFLVVAVTAIAVLVVATLVGVDLSRTAATREDRAHMAQDLATLAGVGYDEQGAWTGGVLADVQDRAEAANAHFIVVAPDGAVVYGGPVGTGFRAKAFTAPISVAGQEVATGYLAFRDGTERVSPGVSTTWLVTATAVAGIVALLMALLLTRRLTKPLVGLAATARSFAAGDRAARAATDAPGELGELGQTFNEMADEVTAGEDARRHLSADVAHELRTPLAALQGGLEELTVGDRPADQATLAALHLQAVRLGRIVADLAELSQAEAAGPRLEPQDVELADLVRSGLGVWQSTVEAAGQVLRTELEDGVWVWADPDRLHQVVGNLLTNAVRHCRPGDTVTVSVAASGRRAVVAVADTGPGIPAADVPHVFDRFWRAGDRAGTPGSGRGLPVARALVEASGGQISLESQEGVGTVVTIRLPLSG